MATGVCAVAVASGEIELDTSPSPGRRWWPRSATDRIDIDLRGVTFLDSTGMGVMVSALNEDHRLQRESLVLVGPAARARTVLEITCLTDVFPICASADEAVGELG